MEFEEIKYIDRTVKCKNLTVVNVPHAIHPSVEECITAPVMMKLIDIFNYMAENNLTEFNFEDFVAE